ncbi:unnamed protein product, partial [marine sediment metagenome]
PYYMAGSEVILQIYVMNYPNTLIFQFFPN